MKIIIWITYGIRETICHTTSENKWQQILKENFFNLELYHHLLPTLIILSDLSIFLLLLESVLDLLHSLQLIFVITYLPCPKHTRPIMHYSAKMLPKGKVITYGSYYLYLSLNTKECLWKMHDLLLLVIFNIKYLIE